MPKVDFNEAKYFLEKISKGDKVSVIHHDDLDGFASGIIFLDYCKKAGALVGNIPFSYTSDQPNVLKQVKDSNIIIITDLGPGAIPEILEGVKDKDVLYVDHHQKERETPPEILEYRTIEEGYIPCSRTAHELCGGKYWLAVAGTMSDMGHIHEVNKEFLDKFLKRNKISQKKFLESIVFTLNKVIIYFGDRKKKAFELVRKLKNYKDVKNLKKYARPVEKEIQKHIKAYKKKKEMLGIVSFYYFEPSYPIKSTVSTQLSFMNKDDIIVFALPSRDAISLSGRSQNPQANMIDVLKMGISDLKNAGAGGHIPAAGGHIQKKDLNSFKENLKRYKID